MTELDLKEKIAADRGSVCSPQHCRCPTCGATELLLRAALVSRGIFKEDARRVAVRAFDCGSASYPYLASVRVDGREVYRIETRPDEVFAPDVLEDITKALRRPI